ncbi:hypothetical protein NUSPORA_00089 [Nucleospora cyclopteri]
MKKFRLPKATILTNTLSSIQHIKIILPVLITTSIFISCLELQIATKEGEANNNELDAFELSIYVFQKIFIASLALFNNLLSLSVISKAYRNAIKSFFKQYIELPYVDFVNLGVGTIQFSINRRANSLISFLKIVCIRFASNIIFLSIILSKLGSSITFAAIIRSIGVLTFFMFFITLIQIKRTKLRKGINTANEKNGQKILDILLNYERIKAYDNDKVELDKYHHVLSEMVGFYQVYEGLYEILSSATKICFLIITVTIYFYMNEDDETPPMLFEQIFFVSIRLKTVVGDILGDLNRVYTSYINFVATGMHKSRKDKSIQKFYMARFCENIEILNLSVRLNQQRILKNISCTIYKGEKIAICGESSSGKSVFLNSIVGNYTYKGAILFDGFEQKQILEKSLYRNIAYIPQEPTLFNESLIDNLKLGNNKIEDSKVMELCDMFGMHELFRDLGYTKSVGTLGNKLSGGQKQKVLFMRSLIKNAPILIFDQAMSNIDAVTEEFLLKSLNEKVKRATFLAVVKNLNTLKFFDRILLLKKGRLVADGTFEELCKSNKKFINFYYNSFNKDEKIEI